MTKEYHIVMCYGNAKKLMDSKILDFSNEDIKLIVYNDNLSEGKLFDLRTLEGIDEREKSIADFYGADFFYKPEVKTVTFLKFDNPEDFEQSNMDIYEGVVHEAESSRKDSATKLNAQLNEIAPGDSIYLWLGNESNEYLFKIAILHYLQNLSVKIYDIDWSSLKYNTRNGFVVTPYLSTCEIHQMLDIKNQFKLVARETIEEKSLLWRDLYQRNSFLKVLTKDLSIQEGDESMFDDVIIARCSSKFKKSSLVVGYTLGDIWDKGILGIGDSFIFRRIEQLVELGILEARNVVKREGGFDLFEVRLVN